MPTFINWAHRGASGHVPENTLSAFELAIAMGADGIECDLQESQDGHLIVFHDSTLKRIAGQSRPVNRIPLAELKQIDVGSWFSAPYRKERIPTLLELIEQMKSPLLLNLEIKKASPQKVLGAIYQQNAKDRVLISSFNHALLSHIRALDSAIAIGYLVDQKVTAAILREARKMRAQSLHLSAKTVTPEVIRRVHREGLRVYPYTIDETSQMVRFMEMGADGLFTNYPDRLSKQIKEKPC